MTQRSFAGRSVVVTGAAAGLGRAIAQRFAAAGARIAALDRDAAGLEALRAELGERGTDCLALPCDVTDASACAAAIGAAAQRFGGIDVLVNNAGISHRSAFERTSPEVIRKVMAVNFFGAVQCTHAALPHLRERAGLIVVISSVAGFAPLVGRTGYAASKHALHGFFDSLRTELAPQGVDVTLVCPSFIDTGIERNALGGDGSAAKQARVTVGERSTAQAVAQRVFEAAGRSRPLVLVGRTATLAWWVSRLAPQRYAKMMARRLRGEFFGDPKA